MKRILVLLAGLVLATAVYAAAPRLPTYLSLPAQLTYQNPEEIVAEDYGEGEFFLHDAEEPAQKRGKHWNANFVLNGAAEDLAQKDYWALIKPALLKGGWTSIEERDANPYIVTLRYQKNGKDVWARFDVFNRDDIRVDMVEISGPVLKLALTPPATTPEKFAIEKGDFPYLASLPGSKQFGGQHDDGPMSLTLPGSDVPEIVGTGSISKDYANPPGLSNLAWITVYGDALKAAGWNVLDHSQGMHQSDAVIVAHYARNGRNIWAYLHEGGGEYLFRIADVGAQDLSAQLAKQCHVPLYGVLFDFNKASLKVESDSILQQVLGVLQKDAALKVEIQGHTDNVGGDDYNQKLSEARAKSVVAWLAAHGIAPARLTAKGFGKTMPVASNDDDEGRAKNRRVEIAKQGCKH